MAQGGLSFPNPPYLRPGSRAPLYPPLIYNYIDIKFSKI